MPPAVHSDGDGVVGQQAGERGAGKLAALIVVEDLRLAMAGQSFLDRLNAEPGLHRDREPPGQDAPAEPVDHGGEADEATRHANVGQVHGPDLVGTGDRQIAQEIRIDPVARCWLRTVGLTVEGLGAYPLHQRRDMPAAGPKALGDQQVAQHAAACEGEIKMQFIYPANQGEIGGRGQPRQVVNTAPADVEHLGLPRDRQIMGAVDRRFAQGLPALPSAPAKKSFSSVSSPILACSTVRSTSGRWLSPQLSDPNTPAAPSSNCAFHWVIWLG